MSEFIQGAKYRWKLPESNQQAVLDVASSYNLSFPIAQTLVSRGFSTKTAIDSFLFSSLEKDVAHPSIMKDARKAVDRIIEAIAQHEKILICGDYDVDGITSSALMLICLLPLKAQINFFLPHRVKDGYGLSSNVVRKAAENGYTVLITVDNGITAFEPAKVAKEVGIDLIITDHHRAHGHVPDAYAIVNPNQHDCPYPFKVLAGVGVSFKLMSLLYEVQGLPLPAKVYELLLLGTVADVVPLLGENRFWVRHGLTQINAIESPSLKILKQNGNLQKPRISATDIGFSITPQINALGRLEDARAGVKFLIGADIKQTEEVGKTLLELNQARKEIERSIINDIEMQIACNKIDLTQENIIMAASDAWPPGVIGLVASRMVGAYGKPTLLFHITKDGLAKGSCRSISEFNMFNALQQCSDLIKQFGGHAQAAGLSLPIKNLEPLKERLEQMVREQVTPDDLQLKVSLDAQALLSDLNKKFMADLAHLEPFGHENKQPLFYIKDVVLVQKPSLLKDLHVKCNVFADGIIKPVIFFNRPELFELLTAQGDEPFDIAGNVVENHWNDRVNVELNGLDVAKLKR
jgi:single-stranded-DNA-specific exonuclease